jgi:hypothetical protein
MLPANKSIVIYLFFPETARLTLEEIAKNFGEEVAVHLTDATDEEKTQLDQRIVQSSGLQAIDISSTSKDVNHETRSKI